MLFRKITADIETHLKSESNKILLIDGARRRKKGKTPIILSNENIALSAFRKTAPDAYMIRLVNNCKESADCVCMAFDKALKLSFGKYEVKTLIYKDGELRENDLMLFI